MSLVHEIVASPAQTSRNSAASESVIKTDKGIGNLLPQQSMKKGDRCSPKASE